MAAKNHEEFCKNEHQLTTGCCHRAIECEDCKIVWEAATKAAEEKFTAGRTLEVGHLQQIKDSIPLLKSAMESLSRRCDGDERDGALYNIDAVIAVLESVN